MSKPREANLVKLIVGLISGRQDIINSILREVENRFGSIDFISGSIKFNHTDYYKEEMGDNLFRKLISFEKLIKPETLSDIKLFTNSIENEHRLPLSPSVKGTGGGKRIVNIDPGYISLEKLVLATGKNFAHRIYLRNGIYADLTLIYKNGDFQPLEWTFPDYAGADIRMLLKGIRARYVHQLQQEELTVD